MRFKTVLLASAFAVAALSATAQAADRHGWYFGLEGGIVKASDNNGAFGDKVEYESGFAGLGEIGFAFNGHWRGELELGMRRNETDKVDGVSVDQGDLRNYTAMINAIWDAPISNKWALSLGAGVGMDRVYQNLDGDHLTDTVFAAQGIAGLTYQMSTHWDLHLTYRYLWAADPDVGFDTCGNQICGDSIDLRKHTLTIGFRYGYDEPPAPAPVVAPPVAPPAPKHFIIFFGFNKCNITAEADSVLSEAASAAKAGNSSSITIVGHTDTVGSPAYNQKLSECRANAAKSNLAGKGVPEGAISASGKGETELMVQTGDGVKEPQNVDHLRSYQGGSCDPPFSLPIQIRVWPRTADESFWIQRVARTPLNVVAGTPTYWSF
jgi:OmpA-OmpF porin, OOP family